MDPTQQKLMKRPDDATGGEGPSPGAMLIGAVVLIIGGVVLLGLAHASVADVGGGMLVLVGLALGAASVWISTQQEP